MTERMLPTNAGSMPIESHWFYWSLSRLSRPRAETSVRLHGRRTSRTHASSSPATGTRAHGLYRSGEAQAPVAGQAQLPFEGERAKSGGVRRSSTR